ncbi:alpha/beta fold hydrolase [Thermoflexibacter ruber]|uniref:Pimeloyl-ACP methyl ester carboxylesterase n=1 Tax=Thermoflexibacter ruber TaxID=1003 RepID=A0A1I2I1Z3_9BACT|nr:alpha/beta hydrolase [Thermoflexibacter ruber]SFF35698.1 Pimeloyl-ACP methyl ester carboxylesterase [Thermoflexibacter ruber]
MPILSYLEKGQGNPVVLIHGFCEDKSLWVKFVSPLSASNRLVCVDLPNFGESPTMQEISIEQMADSVIDTIKHLQIEKCVVIGHSLGGYVALAMAELYPEQLAGLGLFHSTAFEDTPERKENRNKAIASIKENGVEPFVRTLIPSLFSPVQKQKENIKKNIDILINNAKQIPPANIITTLQAMRDRKDRIDILKNINLPVLFIVGKDDVPVPLEASMAQCYLPKNSLVSIMAEVGHMGMIEAEKNCQIVVKNFLEYCWACMEGVSI